MTLRLIGLDLVVWEYRMRFDNNEQFVCSCYGGINHYWYNFLQRAVKFDGMKKVLTKMFFDQVVVMVESHVGFLYSYL